MTIQTFKSTDFDVFTVDGLEERMSAIKTNIHPKLEALGNNLQNTYPNKLMRTFYHVAKHARRKVNPPNDTCCFFQQINEDIKCYRISKSAYGVLMPSYTLV